MRRCSVCGLVFSTTPFHLSKPAILAGVPEIPAADMIEVRKENIAHDHQQLYAEHEGVLQLVHGTRADIQKSYGKGEVHESGA